MKGDARTDTGIFELEGNCSGHGCGDARNAIFQASTLNMIATFSDDAISNCTYR